MGNDASVNTSLRFSTPARTQPLQPPEARDGTFLENRSGEYPPCLTVSQFLLKIHQFIIAYLQSALQPYSTKRTKPNEPEAQSNGSDPALARRHDCVKAPAYIS
jgi:hypothetical protein